MIAGLHPLSKLKINKWTKSGTIRGEDVLHPLPKLLNIWGSLKFKSLAPNCDLCASQITIATCYMCEVYF